MRLPKELLAECLQGYLDLVFQDTSARPVERRVRVLEVGFTVPELKDTKVKGALRKITFSLSLKDVQELYRRYLR
jgi:hypothetical protein